MHTGYRRKALRRIGLLLHVGPYVTKRNANSRELEIMGIPPIFAKVAWIAAPIAGISVLLLVWVFLNSFTPTEIPDNSPSQIHNQASGNGNIQIGTVNGSVVINGQPSWTTDVYSIRIEGKWDEEQAFRYAIKMLDKYDWRSAMEELELPVKHSIIGSYSLLYREREAIVLAVSSTDNGFQCHPCAPFLSFFEFEGRASGWGLKSVEIAVIRTGSYGTFPSEWLKVRAIGNGRYGVLLYNGDLNQGYTIGGTDVLTRIADSFRSVLAILTEEAGPGGGGWSSKFAFKETPEGLFDLIVSRTGRRGDKDLRLIDADPIYNGDVANSDGIVRKQDTFHFDGKNYSRDTHF